MKSLKVTVAFALMLLLATGMIACKKTEETTVVVPAEQAVPEVDVTIIEPAAPAIDDVPEAVAPEAAEEVAPEAPAAQ